MGKVVGGDVVAECRKREMAAASLFFSDPALKSSRRRNDQSAAAARLQDRVAYCEEWWNWPVLLPHVMRATHLACSLIT